MELKPAKHPIGYSAMAALNSPADNRADGMLNSTEHAVKQLIEALGVDEGEHTAGTPARVAKAWRDMLWGYTKAPADYLDTTFPAPADPGLVVQTGIDVQSTCAHHLLPFGGHATVAYRPQPGQRIVGLSKLTRLVYAYCARLQVQERIGQQVVDDIVSKLAPVAAICLVTASHDCIRLRGVRSPASLTVTEAVRGEWQPYELAMIHQLHLGR